MSSFFLFFTLSMTYTKAWISKNVNLFFCFSVTFLSPMWEQKSQEGEIAISVIV